MALDVELPPQQQERRRATRGHGAARDVSPQDMSDVHIDQVRRVGYRPDLESVQQPLARRALQEDLDGGRGVNHRSRDTRCTGSAGF